MSQFLRPYLEGIWQAMSAANMRSASHFPATNTQATCTIAAPGAGSAILVKTVSATLMAGVGVGTGTVELTDGTTTYWRHLLVAAGTLGAAVSIAVDFVLPVNTAPILRFTAASGAGTQQVVAMTGVVINGA